MNPSVSDRFASWKSAARSVWQDDADPAITNAEAASLPERVRYLVVGLGITGAAVCHELVGKGINPTDIFALDAATPAFGASGRNAGFVLSLPASEPLDWEEIWGRDTAHDLIRENIENRELVKAFVREHDVARQEGGSLTAAANDHEKDRLLRTLELLDSAGAGGYRWLDTMPGPHGGRYAGCVEQPADLGIHPVRYVERMLLASRVPFMTGCVLDRASFELAGDAIRVVTSRGTIMADRVILATNAYIATLLDSRKAFPVMAIRNQVTLGAIKGETTNRLWGDAVHYANDGFDYWRQLPDGRLLLGGARNVDMEGEQSAELNENPRVLDYLEKDLAVALAGGRAFVPEKRWQGIIGASPDLLPLLGVLNGFEDRVYYIGGFSGYGLGFHRVVARRLAAHLLDGGDFGPYNLHRFKSRRAPASVERRFSPGGTA